MGVLDEYVKSTGVEYKETEINDSKLLTIYLSKNM